MTFEVAFFSIFSVKYRTTCGNAQATHITYSLHFFQVNLSKEASLAPQIPMVVTPVTKCLK